MKSIKALSCKIIPSIIISLAAKFEPHFGEKLFLGKEKRIISEEKLE